MDRFFNIKDIEDIARKNRILLLVDAAHSFGESLDVVGDAKTLGKPVGSDARNEKTTYVSMYGLEEARKKVSEYTEESIVLLQNFDGEKTFLMELMTWMIQRDK